MTAHSTSTDNTSVPNKVLLRREATQKLKSVNVLDLFAGYNVLWSYIETERYYGIEVEKGKGKNLSGDNLKAIPSLDLSGFNVIDCDSYGIPVKQIKALYDNETLMDGTVIIYTCIGNAMSQLSTELVKEFGLTAMYKKCKTLLNGYGNDLFHAWLYNKGVRQVREYEEKGGSYKKQYGYFVVERNRK